MHLFLPLLLTSNQHQPLLAPLLFKQSKSTPPLPSDINIIIMYSIPQMSAEEAKDALISEVSSHCCYGKKPAENMAVSNVAPSSAFHVCKMYYMLWGLGLPLFVVVQFENGRFSFLQYQLETFAEGRNTVWAFEPFSGSYLPNSIIVHLNMCMCLFTWTIHIYEGVKELN